VIRVTLEVSEFVCI